MSLFVISGVPVACAQAVAGTTENKSVRSSSASISFQEKNLSPVQKDLDVLLKEALAWRTLDKATVLQRLAASPNQVMLVNREPLQRVTLVKNPAQHPGNFYFRGEDPILLTLGASTLEHFSDADVRAVLTGKPELLRSSYGKASMVYVYPELGLSFTTQSQDGHKLQYLEIFAPRSLDAYKQTLYQAPLSPDSGRLGKPSPSGRKAVP